SIHSRALSTPWASAHLRVVRTLLCLTPGRFQDTVHPAALRLLLGAVTRTSSGEDSHRTPQTSARSPSTASGKEMFSRTSSTPCLPETQTREGDPSSSSTGERPVTVLASTHPRSDATRSTDALPVSLPRSGI